MLAVASTTLIGPPAQAAGPVFTGTVAIQSFRDGQGEIYEITPTTQTNLSNNPAEDDDAAYSPDGSKIAFKSTRSGNADIWVMEADGSNPLNLTNVAGDDSYPTWSPDGNTIAFHSDRDGNNEIYSMNADGTNPVRLTNDPALDVVARFSPDGSKIAFVSTRDAGDVDVWVIDADGGNPTQLTTDAGLDHFPSWSPDGSKITFASTRTGGFEVYTMNADGTNTQQLTSDGASSNAPAYSPDGSQIAFQRSVSGNIETFVMGSTGGDATQLTAATGLDGDPDWKPPAPPPPDTDPPETTITGGPAEGSTTTSTSETFTFTSDEAGSTFACQLDAGTVEACDSGSKTYTGLGVGPHTFTVTATDPAGNPDPDPATRSWTIQALADTDPPETTITGGPAESSTTTSTSETFTFTSDEPGSTFACQLDTGPVEECNSGSKTYTDLSVGPHTFSVTATDPALNPDPTPATRSWTVEAEPSDTPTTLQYTGGQIVSGGQSVTASAKLGGTGCTAGKTISFALDRDPDGTGPASAALGTAVTANKGVASLTVPTTGWNGGVYSITAAFAGSTGCGASADEATLTIGSATNPAEGGGYVIVGGAGRTNFGFTIRSAGTGFEGEFLMVNPGRWRLAGPITSYTRSGRVGTASGSGDLYRWDTAAATWVLSEAGVTFSISFEDSGTKKPDRFGITSINHVVQPGEPAPLPTGARQTLKAGGVTLR